MIEFLDHTADIKFRVSAKTEENLFEETAVAFCEYVIGKKKNVNGKKKSISIEGDDRCELLCNFVDELIFLLDSDGFISFSAKVKFTKKGLNAELLGDDAKKYDINQVKAATYAEMYVKKISGGWEAQVVLDV
jgi:SHS2 domain-containing protein